MARPSTILQRAILAPVDQNAPLLIPLKRTPYGMHVHLFASIPSFLKELMADGYILVMRENL